MKKLFPIILIFLFAGCTKISDPVSEGFIDNQKPDVLKENYQPKTKMKFELTGTSKEVYLYYSTFEGNVKRTNQQIPWEHSYRAFVDSLYYINVTNFNDSGFVQLKIYKNDVLIKTRSMEGFEANMRETGSVD